MLNRQNDLAQKLKVRQSRPSTLASAIGGLFGILGIRASDSDLIANWNRIVTKDISDIAKVVAIKTTKNKKFNIVLRPVNSAFGLELSYKLEDIKKQVNNYYGRDAIEKITIRK